MCAFQGVCDRTGDSVRPSRFLPTELRLIQEIGRYTDLSEVQSALQRYHKENQDAGGFLRKKLKVRLSGESLLRLAAELLG